jgi:hypothetical protein
MPEDIDVGHVVIQADDISEPKTRLRKYCFEVVKCLGDWSLMSPTTRCRRAMIARDTAGPS